MGLHILIAMSTADLIAHLQRELAHKTAVLVTVTQTQGSVPREVGTWMAVFESTVIGTIGGGHLEWRAIAQARSLLADPTAPAQTQRHALGPSLGQCCGGVMELRFERLALALQAGADWLHQLQAPLTQLALFGGGHVGQAIVRVMLTLPYALTWIDSRDSVFPDGLAARVRCEHSQPVERAVHHLPAGSQVLIMSFSHAEDLDIVHQCLLRQREQGDLPFVGLIGSQTKWATFRHRLLARGHSEAALSQITCPIGLVGIEGKEPEVIAVAVAAQLLMQRAAG
jgi:xanthine dehydrogenase accessory factor